MKIIDVEKHGNVVRFYLGEKTKDWGWTNRDYKDYTGSTPNWLKPSDTYYGDDWSDRPISLNAGPVYDEFIKGHKDIAFDFDDVVLGPEDDEFDHSYSKDDMRERKVPCLIIIKKSYLKEHNLERWQVDSFKYAVGFDGISKYYFGDDMEPDDDLFN